jgi:hypothetical protein
MTNPSNIYAEHIFANQPISLWSLDDRMDYLSYIGDSFRDMSANWSSSSEDSVILEEDKDSSPQSQMPETFKYSISAGKRGGTQITLTSNQTFTSAAEDIVVGLYVNPKMTSSCTVRIGYKLGSTTTFIDEVAQQVSLNRWSFVSEVFPTSSSITAKIVIEISYTDSPTPSDIPIFFINGLTVGLKSEEFFKISPGIQGMAYDISGININPDDVVLAESYGKQSGFDAGLYFINNNVLLAKNSTIPMVYGAANSTILIPNENGEPSMIVPAHGFMNRNGRSVRLTLEMWLRINTKSISGSYRKIAGPLKSNNGIYVDGPHLIVKYGEYSISHYVGEWFRPMLVDLAISDTQMNLFINGSFVAGTNMNRAVATFEESEASQIIESITKSQDFIGFYAYDDIPTLEVDAVALYPYMISEDLAKRNFVYGQATAYPQDINVAYDGKSFFVDYPSAEYSRNLSYPDPAKWEQGIYDNVLIRNNLLCSPEQALPVYASNSELTLSQLLEDCYDEEETQQYICLKPNEDWEDVNSYLVFNSFKNVTTKNDLVFGVFEGGQDIEQEQLLFKIESSTNEYIKVSLKNNIVSYRFKENGAEEIDLPGSTPFDISDEEFSGKFVVGINANDLYRVSSPLTNFFGNPQALRVLVGGSYDGQEQVSSDTYRGKIYSFSFATEKDAKRYSEYVSNGVMSGNLSAFNKIKSSISSYTLVHGRTVDSSVLDRYTRSYWDDSLSLSYMSSKKDDGSGSLVNTLDYIQINFDYPKLSILSDNTYNSANQDVRVFVSFQYLNSGLHQDTSTFLIKPVQTNMVVQPQGDWKTSLYEVTDGTVIYPPTMPEGESFEMLAMMTHIDLVSKGVRKPINIRSLQYASRASEKTSSDIANPRNGIGSRFGEYAYPYIIENGLPDFTFKSPVSIYKGSTPYLYMTGNSGLSLVGDYNPENTQGFIIPINKNAEDQFNISSLQFAMLWKDRLLPEQGSPERLFDISGISATIYFYIESINEERTRGRIYATTQNSQPYSGLRYYWNGNSVKDPIVNIDEWGMLGIIFDPFLTFDASPGSFRAKNHFLINNFSFYQLSELAQTQQIVKNFWDLVKGLSSDNYWSEYTGMTWKDVLYQVATITAAIDPSEVYEVYLGTNKIIANANESSNKLRFNNYQYVTYTGATWDRITQDPL